MAPRKNSTRAARAPRPPYTSEEGHFIWYYRDDLAMTWAQVLEMYNNLWTRHFRRPERSIAGLQSRYYRVIGLSVTERKKMIAEEDKDSRGRPEFGILKKMPNLNYWWMGGGMWSVDEENGVTSDMMATNADAIMMQAPEFEPIPYSSTSSSELSEDDESDGSSNSHGVERSPRDVGEGPSNSATVTSTVYDPVHGTSFVRSTPSSPNLTRKRSRADDSDEDQSTSKLPKNQSSKSVVKDNSTTKFPSREDERRKKRPRHRRENDRSYDDEISQAMKRMLREKAY